MSIWQFRAAFGGYAKANSPDDGSISREEAERLASWIDAPAGWA